MGKKSAKMLSEVKLTARTNFLAIGSVQNRAKFHLKGMVSDDWGLVLETPVDSPRIIEQDGFAYSVSNSLKK